MTERETVQILDEISYQNKNFSYTNEMLRSWYQVLKDYDFEDVIRVVKESLSEEKFQYQTPSAYYLIKNLRKTSEKQELNSYQVFCPICGRLFKTYQEEEKHFDRCSSVEYVIREYKKWYGKDLDKKELFEMNEDDFKIRYLKLLSHIYKNTANEQEKVIIEHILKGEK